MAKSILVKIKQPPEILFAKASQEAANQGYELIGDAVNDPITGAGVRCNDKFSGNNVLIMTIRSKPALLSWNAIERKLTRFLTE
ncbi:hypothetical protein [Methylomonas sp. MgM2]